MTSCTRPLTRRPNQFIAATRAMIPPVASSWVCRPPPALSATYAPAKPAAVGAPIGIAK